MGDYFEWLICKKCGIKIDAKDYDWYDIQREICDYCIEEDIDDSNHNR